MPQAPPGERSRRTIAITEQPALGALPVFAPVVARVRQLMAASAEQREERRGHHCGETAAEAESPLLSCGDVASASAMSSSSGGGGGGRVVDRSAAGAGGPCNKNFCYECLEKVYGQTATAVSCISFGPSRRCPYCRNECCCETCTRIERARRLRQLFLEDETTGAHAPQRHVKHRPTPGGVMLQLQQPPSKKHRNNNCAPGPGPAATHTATANVEAAETRTPHPSS